MVIVLILFNIAMYIYFDNSARDELKNTFYTMHVLIEKQIMDFVSGEDQSASALTSLSAALTASRLTGNTEFYILSKGYEVLYPVDKGSLETDNSLLQSIENYDFTGNPGDVIKARTETGTYYIAGMAFDELESGRLNIVFTESMTDNDELIKAINIILSAIMLISAGVGILYALASARGISRPIQRVCQYAKEIGNGHFITVSEDKTLLEIDELIDSINEMSSRLKASDEAQKRFLQNASHELRTPLMSIQGYSEAIEKGIGGEPKEAAAIIRSESIRLTTIVEELLTLSKIDNNIYDSEFIKIDLGEALSECVYRLKGFAYKENKNILLEAEPGIVVSADESLLAKAINNVVSNGIRHARSEVAVRLSYSNGTALIIVSDDGDGFDPLDLPHIFDRFYKGRGGKFGLGLTIAKKAFEIMNGSIKAYNAEIGAVFELRLSAVQQGDE